ncbi:CehA/McbA family metallohydrolase [Paenibacillus senegalensis]|uniref:CehA/McbA family metallohydrolase n=1 Tax=Paenibacillus senegalensis TaxID=1465766 RepID=UPI000288C8AD|nr:CehA/McbA family metallohydrolase [Paenibacillus senegalensis]
MKWFACELHTHTVHSDGSQTLQELATGARKLGFEAIALTDHNTMSGLIDKEEVQRESGLIVISGMEWTTFYGHMVTIGINSFADWRQTDKDSIDQGIAAVHRSGGLAGLAHPFRIGSPACTGCYWEYDIKDWSAVDYIEVWSGTFAPIQISNHRAFALWTEKLNERFRVAATSGRDWHSQTKTEEPLSVTYLGVPEDAVPTERQLVEALRCGRVSVTIGPLLELEVELDGECIGIGGVIPHEKANQALNLRIKLDFSVRAESWSLPDQGSPEQRIKVRSDQRIEAECFTNDEATLYEMTVLGGEKKWLRAELWGSVHGVSTLIAFTNAIYFD